MILIGTLISLYLLNKQPNSPVIPIPTSKPTPTPTPRYYPYLNQPADYVGVISQIAEDFRTITITRDDESQVVLNLETNVPFYHLIQTNPNTNVETLSVTSLRIGHVLSVYTKDKNVVALFVAYDN